MIPHLCPFELETFKAFFSRIINLLLTKLARDRTGRISARGLDSTDRAQRGPYKKDRGPIFSQYGPRTWLISIGNRMNASAFRDLWARVMF